jgi:hypothetical protein
VDVPAACLLSNLLPRNGVASGEKESPRVLPPNRIAVVREEVIVHVHEVPYFAFETTFRVAELLCL